jgi:carbonic anhydrase/acetyltransferase-like protein (isoleucine patch superfamily)
MILEYSGLKPKIGKNVFIAPTAVIIGDVELKDGASIWYGTVVRGDRDTIIVGKNTNIQDNCTLHADVGQPVVIGDNVTVGHNVVIHACTIEDNCMIGISATVLTGAHIKTGSIVAAGAVVRQEQTVGPHHLVVGIPATFKKELSEATAAENLKTAQRYCQLALEYLTSDQADG